MALLKEVTTKFRVKASYWKVGMLTIDTNLKEVSFSLNLYFNKESAEDQDTFLDTFSVTDLMGVSDKTMYNKYFGEDKGEHYKDWQTACYNYVKDNVPFFKDAKDDPEEIALLTKEK